MRLFALGTSRAGSLLANKMYMFPETRRLVHAIGPVIVLAAGFAFLPQKISAKPEYTHVTKQECAYCHASLRDRKLTEAGVYFRKHRTLKGYRPG